MWQKKIYKMKPLCVTFVKVNPPKKNKKLEKLDAH